MRVFKICGIVVCYLQVKTECAFVYECRYAHMGGHILVGVVGSAPRAVYIRSLNIAMLRELQEAFSASTPVRSTEHRGAPVIIEGL